MNRTKHRPRVISPCVADRYTHGRARIAEFSFGPDGGGLIRFDYRAGRPTVEIYNVDPDVIVIGPFRQAAR